DASRARQVGRQPMIEFGLGKEPLPGHLGARDLALGNQLVDLALLEPKVFGGFRCREKAHVACTAMIHLRGSNKEQPCASTSRQRPNRNGGPQCARFEATRRASAASAVANGVVGSRSGMTRPMVCTTSGSTMGMVLNSWTAARVACTNLSGTTLTQ